MAIDKSLMQSILPPSTFLDLASNTAESSFRDIENDIDCLLNWLQPYYPFASNVVPEPSPRIRAAIRSCLKDEISQIAFVKLYLNSFRPILQAEFVSYIGSCRDKSISSFVDIMSLIKLIRHYYSQYTKFLNLAKLPKNLFDRNLNSLLFMGLVESNDSNFVENLTNYLNHFLFVVSKSAIDPDLAEYVRILVSMGLSHHVNSIIIKLSIKRIKQYVITTCSGVWDEPLLEKMNHWIKVELYPSFSLAVNYTDPGLSYLAKLAKIGHDELVSLRIREIFTLITHHPRSSIALNELHQCILFTSSDTISQAYQRAKLVDSFISACQINLLHSGVNTVDVITTYISTIRSFLIIDPKGVLLDKVVRPIRRYLKNRDDIVIKLVHGLLDDSDCNDLIDLAHELRKGTDMSIMKNNNKSISLHTNNVVVDDASDLDWLPDPIDALPDFKKGKVTDVVESLISIFDLKELFIDEFTNFFAEKLINLHDYNLTEIREHLGYLKDRFGKNEFTTLDVMIRDIRDSQKTITDIQKQSKSSLNFHSTIISHLYWQPVCDKLSANDFFHVPDIVNRHFEEFNEIFMDTKHGRSLKLLPSMGRVKLDLETRGITKLFDVTPEKAAVVYLFNETAEALSPESVAEKLLMPSYVANKALDFWKKENILIETLDGLFKSNEDLNILPYLEELLKSEDSLPLARIHSLLQLRFPNEQYDLGDLTLQQLDDYLQSLVASKKLRKENEKYLLP